VSIPVASVLGLARQHEGVEHHDGGDDVDGGLQSIGEKRNGVGQEVGYQLQHEDYQPDQYRQDGDLPFVHGPYS